MSFCKGFTQGGSNADVVIADAFLKGITDGVDWETAYEAVISDAEGQFPSHCEAKMICVAKCEQLSPTTTISRAAAISSATTHLATSPGTT